MKLRRRPVISAVIALAFGVLAAPPLAVLLVGLADSTFRPGNFPSALVALTALLLAISAVVWLVASQGPRGLAGVILGAASASGLLVGVYGLLGTWMLIGDCRGVQSAASIAASFPEGYCQSQAYVNSLLIGCYLIAIGVVSVVSLFAQWRLGREREGAALD